MTHGPIPASSRILGLRLQSGDPDAIREVVNALKSNAGDMRATALALGVAEGSLHRWAQTIPKLGRALRKQRRGRGARKTESTS